MRKRITSLLIVLCMAFSFLPVISLSVFADTITAFEPAVGDGSEDNPYQIASAENLAWFRDKVNAGKATVCAKLTADIDLSGDTNWVPIGTSTNKYSGTFDGRNYNITSLRVDANTSDYMGLFGYCSAASIRNVGVLKGYVRGYRNLGGIAGHLEDGTIYNCFFTGDLVSDKLMNVANAGLIAGEVLNGTISDCWTDGTVYSYVGQAGICGYASDVTIERCFSNVKLTMWRPHSDNVEAGICAYMDNNTIINNTYSNVTGSGYSAMGRSLRGECSVNFFHTYQNRAYAPDASVHNSRKLNGSGASDDAKSGDGSYDLSAAQFIDKSYFPGWDFENTWEIVNGKYPTLKQRVDLESSSKRTIYVYDNEITKINLPDYFNLILSTDKKYNQDDCFDFEVTSNKTVEKNEFDEETGLPEKQTVTLASVGATDTDQLELNGEVGAGVYNITVNAVDKYSERTNRYDAFDIPLEVVVKNVVPKPEVLSESFAYSRARTLSSVLLTEGWSWKEPYTCPRDSNKTGYAAVYQFADGTAEDHELVYVTSLLDAAGMSYTYDEENNRIITYLTVPVTESAESQKPVKFVVTDADTENEEEETPIAGAYINTAEQYDDEFPNDHYTDENGELKAELSPGKRTIHVEASGYKAYDGPTDPEIARSNTGTTVYIKLEPTRYSFTAPAVYEKNEDGSKTTNKIANAKVTITKVDGTPAAKWNGGMDSLTVKAEKRVDLADGVYKLTSSTGGYSTDDVVYVKIDRSAAEDARETYYESYNVTNKTLGTAKDSKDLYALKLDNPMYYVQITKDKKNDITDPNYTVIVTLSNIKATLGTFGLRWDSELFALKENEDTLDGYDVTLGSSIDIFKTPEDYYPEKYYETPFDPNENGYYVFEWQAPEGEELDTEINSARIATFKFELMDISNADKITIDTFGIEPWTETVDAVNWVKDAANKDKGDLKMWEFWRKVDSANLGSSLGEGRIEASKAVINDINMDGFFQAAVNGDLGDTANPADFYDVMTQLVYDFKVNSVIRFHTVDSLTEEDIEDVRVRLFGDNQKMWSDNTNYFGRTGFSVDSKTAATTPYTYDAYIKGYWPIPESGLTEDRPSVTARANKATDVLVKLEQKIYHKPVLKKEGDNDKLQLVGDADLGGEKYAYNGRDFHFRVKGVKGYRIKQYPTKADVYVNDVLIAEEIEADANGLFTIDKSLLNYSENENLRALSADELQTLSTNEETKADYGDWSGERPDEDGFRGYNLVIKFDAFDTEELAYRVEGETNQYGHVTYTYDAEKDELPDVESERRTIDGSDLHSYMMVKTKTKENDDVANHKTGTFTFTGNTDEDVVDRVYINGLEVDTYNDLHEFSYTFGEVDMDNNIIVLFRRGDTPSTDTIMTLIVGEFGYADVKTPTPAEDDVMLTRRVYLNPSDDLTFETHPMNGYTLYKVELEKDGDNSRTNITDNAAFKKDERTADDPHSDLDPAPQITYTTYTVSKPTEAEKNITVYVTFRNTKAVKTPNLFVKSYINYGNGVVNPSGILIYMMNDSVELNLKADTANSWLVKSELISPYYDLDNAKEFEFDKLKEENNYVYDTLKEDMALGAVFVEKAFPVEGFVDLNQGADLSSANILSGAKVTFERVNAVKDETTGETTYVKAAKQPVYYTISSALRKDAPFSIELPAGTWNVIVTKPGYLTYTITGFEMKVPTFNDETGEYDVTKFGYNDTKHVQHHVVPYIGSTTEGKIITLTDAANVKSGWRANINPVVRAMADVDNSDNVSIEDLNYVMFNFNRYFVTQTYDSFKENGSETKAYKSN